MSDASRDKVDVALARLRQRPSAQAAHERREHIVQIAYMVQRWRKAANLTQAQLADRIGAKQSQISKLESYDNGSVPNMLTLIDIAHACDRRFVFGSTPVEPRSGGVGGRASELVLENDELVAV